MKRTIIAAASALLLSAITAAPATAQAIQSFSGGTSFAAVTKDETIGFSFTTNSTLSVTALGWLAQDGSLASPHQIGIWNAAGTLLGGATVAADTQAGTIGFRYTAVTPFTLATGQQYFIGGRDTAADGDRYLTSVRNLSTAPQISFIGAASSADYSGFAAPTTVTTGALGRFGPNFQFTVLPSVAAVRCGGESHRPPPPAHTGWPDHPMISGRRGTSPGRKPFRLFARCPSSGAIELTIIAATGGERKTE